MNERLEKELQILRTVFPEIEFHDKDCGWFLIPRHRVNGGGWKQSEVAVSFQVPVGYPGSPPYAFWVSPPLRQAADGGRPVNNYEEPSGTPFPGTWGKFSWSVVDAWQPGPEPAIGSKLLDFALSFRERISEGP